MRLFLIVLFLTLIGTMTGCPSLRPYSYPDSTSPKSTAKTYFKALRDGDLSTLQDVLGGHMATEFRLYREENGDEMARKWYQKDMEPSTVSIDEIHTNGSGHAYVDLSISHTDIGTFRVQLATVKRASNWVVTGIKKLED